MWKVICLYLAASLPLMAAGSGERIEISANNSDLDIAQGVSRLSGNVHIRQGTTEIWGDEGIFSGTKDQPEKLELTGNPSRWKMQLEDGSEFEGEAERIEYDVAANVIRFLGSARIEGPQGTSTGDRFIYDMNTERLSGRSDSEAGRIHFTIDPEALPDDNDSDNTAADDDAVDNPDDNE